MLDETDSGAYRCWIFDMDGTLTLPIHDFEEIRKQIGIPANTPILEAIAEMPEHQAKKISQELHDLEMDLAYQAEPQPQAVAILEALQEAGKMLGILTRNGGEIARATLNAAGLSRFFHTDAIVCRDICLPKPKPDGVHHLLNLWQASKQETIIVGDYLYDIQAGFDAGIKTIHFDRNGLFPWPEFTHYRISDLGEIQKFI